MTLVRILLDSTIRATVLLLLATAAAGLLRSRVAAARQGVWIAALLLALAMPLLAAALPRLPVEIPARMWKGAVSLFHRADTRSSRNDAAARTGKARRRSDLADLDGGWRGEGASRAPIEPWLLAIWALGALGVSTRAAIGVCKARRLVKSAAPITLPALCHALEELSARFRIRRPVRLLASPDVAAPAVIGFLRPAILLPVKHAWSAAEARAVLAHELSHVAGGDCLALAFVRLTCALYWFHPLVWIAARKLTAERERVCDDRVLDAGVPPPEYAALLLDAARSWRASAASGEALAMARPSELEGRLLAILDAGQRRGPLTARHRLLLALAVAAMAIPVGALTLETGIRLAEPAGPEPDQLGDAVAGPRSEIVPVSDPERTVAVDPAAFSGPDAAAIRLFLGGAARMPGDQTDLVPARSRWALGRIRDGQLTGPLLDSLSDRDWRVQTYAAWALAYIGDRRAVPPLLTLLRHPVWRARAMAAFALAQLSDPRATSPMRAALEDPAWQVRSCALSYFGALGDRSFQPEVENLLADRHVAVRVTAEEALAALSR